MGYWKYEIVHDYNATKLIKEFREANSKLKNSAGTEDEELDFIMYAEKDDITISLGRVLLIKMSDAMVSYYHEYKKKEPVFDLSKYWATYIYKQSYSSQTFHFTEDEIAEAFHESVKLQTKKIKDVSVLDAENYIKKVLEKLSESFRKEEKFSREQWDPTLKSDQYLFKKPDEAVQLFIEKCNATQKRLKDFKNQLEVFQSFNIAGFKGKIELVEDTVKFLDECIKNIEELKKHLTENRNEARLNIAYLCGIWGGLVEFIAGFLDIALLAIRILITDAINDTSEINTNLDLLEIREGLEEILGAILKDPKEVFSEIIKGISNYKYSRYDDPKLNDYQLQYNEGEDTVLAIDLIIAIVTIIRGIAKLAKLLPNFTKWVEDVLARNGIGARKVGNALMRLRKVAYGESELSKIAIQFRKTLPKLRHNGNIAVFEYLDEAGNIRRKEFTTIKGNNDHAEIIGMKWLRENGIPDKKVVKVYSELEPCSLTESMCKQRLQRYQNAELEYSYDYPGDGAFGVDIRRNSIKERKNDFKKYFK